MDVIAKRGLEPGSPDDASVPRNKSGIIKWPPGFCAKENASIKECAAICRCGAMGSTATKLWAGPRLVASTLRNDSEFNPISRSAGEAKRLSQRVSYVACRASD